VSWPNQSRGLFHHDQERPFEALTSVILVLLGAVFLGIVFPVISSYFSQTLFDDGVRQQLPAPAREELQRYDTVKLLHSSAIASIDQRLLDVATNAKEENIESLLRLRQHLQNWKDGTEPPLKIASYYLDDIMPLWPLFYACMGWIVFVLKPEPIPRKAIRQHLLPLLTLVVLTYRWPTWIRNTPIGRIGRKTYSFANFDVSVSGFVTQEVMALIVSLLIVIVWIQWSHFWHSCRHATTSTSDPVADTLDFRRVWRLQDLFLQWQVVSVVLFGAFSYYTYFFWKRVAVEGDPRFFAQAVSIHLLWIATWGVISLPLIDSLRQWSRGRDQAVSQLLLNKDSKENQAILAAIDRLQPISLWNLGGSTIMVLGSIVIPIVQAVK
jgi:hypothetical protein